MHVCARPRSLRTGVVLTLLAALLPALAVLGGAGSAHALDDGLARTPPMGWNDWNAFGCSVTERLVEQTADTMVASGMKDAGYTYVNIDDCWMTHSRDAAGHLVPDPAKFPDGIKGTADYVHRKGLKLGIYESAGTATCAGYPGSLGHERQDAADFAAWGVDYLKYDNCNNQGVPYQQRYDAMRDALKATGRPIVYSLCEWGEDSVWTWGAATGHLWRTTGDISASFGSMLSIYRSNVRLAGYAGPGGWNDPDMLEVGNGMSFTEDRTEFTLWAEMAAPLIAGTDLRTATPATLSLYTNRDVIAVDQDPLGRQGTEVSSSGGLHVLAKPLAGGDVAVVLFNENAAPATITTSASTAGLPAAPSYRLTNLWSHQVTSTGGTVSAQVPGHGTVMYRVSVGGGSSVGTTHPLAGASSARCLDVAGGATTPGTPVDIRDCDGGAWQAWTPTASGELRVYGGTQCLDAYDNRTSPGTPVKLWPCNGGANQRWNLDPDGTVTGVQSGLCLDVTGGNTPAGNVNGTRVELWDCNGGANQQWRLV
ncbi:secreted alpha-galactosidase [Streptantibioticus cattleyicolor NRRL 8057 = DSM 46488]|uniref:Alpha-galactosidase n=1 Tax=Streptantibioticus cattleyicolor (strain ATCC 35852 / DSM 46488 / JCM 4925 / NBRC 14057 / NRRL 8057) TaxID=1003195 RepID=F8JSU6_STREN|nr:secreted alpha-galactosidase [Streptantibioticus cattleyicolor NRRL 8057 = DSM 46488]MYS62406.1 alpha-galactosidase [Streptomyces sp. SID5468]CCB78324.1 putative secreted alpha-galactosidase [Streptantibioticus cattleyicolor NRRL 8057 = DSM 46488]